MDRLLVNRLAIHCQLTYQSFTLLATLVRRQLAQAKAEAASADASKEKIKNTINYESVNMATFKVNDSAVSRLSNPEKSAKLFGGEITKGSLEKEAYATLPPGDYCGATAVSYWTNQVRSERRQR